MCPISSTSTSIRSSMKPATTIIVAAGRIASNSSLVRPSDRVGVGPVADVHARLHDLLARAAGRSSASRPTPNAVDRLPVRVADADQLAVDDRGAAGGDEQIAGPHDPAVADDVLVRPARAEPFDRHRATAASASGSVNAPA